MHLVQLVELIDEVLNISRGLGSIYKIDIRLRPEGKKGGLVAALDRYEEYLSHRAEAWERLALVRHRFILGIDANRDRLSGLLCNFIYQHELAPGAIKEISHVRHRMEVELAKEAAEDRFHIKAGAGGLVDIEFAVQLLQLKHGSEYSSLRIPNTLAALAKLKELRKITKSDFQVFSRGYEFLRMLENRLRIASPFGTATISRQPKSLGKIARLLRHTSTYNVPMGQDFESTYLEISHAVRSAYQRILEKLTKLE